MTPQHGVWVPSPGLTVEHFEDGCVIFDPSGSGLHRLDRVGSAVWAELGTGARTADLVDRLAGPDEDRPALAARLDAFLAELADRGLVTSRRA